MSEEKKIGSRPAAYLAGEVHAYVAQVCPIFGVSLGRLEDRSTWRIHFADEATPEQRKAAKEALLAFKTEETHPDYVGPPRVIR